MNIRVTVDDLASATRYPAELFHGKYAVSQRFLKLTGKWSFVRKMGMCLGAASLGGSALYFIRSNVDLLDGVVSAQRAFD